MSSRQSSPTRHGHPTVARLLVALALGVAFIPALQPLLRAEISCGYDNAFHLYRAVQIEHLWDQGVLFSRWAPDMALGFGFPLFVFAGPFAQSLLAFAHRIGLAWPTAMNIVFTAGVVLGGAGMYWLVWTLGQDAGDDHHRQVRIAGGLVGAIAYVYSPFLAYDIFNRGSLWESLSWAFPPLILLGLHRWSVWREKAFLVLGLGSLCAMILCHYPFAALFAPVFGLWVLIHSYLQRDWRVLWRGILLAVLGLGLTAFFWLPPLLERGYIQTDRLLGTWVFDYRYNFLPLSHLLALPRRADPRLVNDWPQKSLGLVPVLVALLPVIRFRRLDRVVRWRVSLLWALVVGLSALTLAPSLWFWDHVPLLAYVQFPWRFLGPAAFCLAMLAGHVPRALSRRVTAAIAPYRAPIATLLSVTLLTANIGWFYPDACSAPADLTVSGMIRWERLTDTLGTTAKGEYLPIWVERFPDTTLDEAYVEGYPVARIRTEDLPAGAEILDARYGAISSELRISTPVTFTARYLAFYYPGWRVLIDGVPTTASPAPEIGLITFDVPAGEHRVVVRFGETPLRLVADAVSFGALLALVGVLVVPLRKQSSRAGQAGGGKPHHNVQWRGNVALWVLGVGILFTVLKIGVIDREAHLWRRSRLDETGSMSGVAVPLAVNFGNKALLLGTSALPQDVSATDTPVVTLYWRALDPGGQDWQIGLTLVGSDSLRWPVGIRPARWGRTPPPFSTWGSDAYARMDELLDLPHGLAPGIYDLELALFDRATAEPASVLNEVGNPIAPALTLGAMRITAPPYPPSLALLDVSGEGGQDCGPIRLLNARSSHEAAAPGDLVTVDMTWESLEATEQDLAVTIELVARTGTAVRQWVVTPSAPWWPTSLWQPGDRWTGKAPIRLPGSLDSGIYTLTLSVAECAATRFPVTIEAPSRTWQLPASFMPMDVAYGDEIQLAGYHLPTAVVDPGTTLPLTLAWQAFGEIDTAYRVFVHLVDERGTVVTQNDGEPDGWTRPTPGWALGEVIVDPRPLQVPETASAGSYEIRVGLYDNQGQRLVTDQGQDYTTLLILSLGE
ncbi:MAG: YfhO family protein [Anaerolineae bacterium]|nr:YfhO family protein [Anaerolineae bacterium]